MTGRLTLAILLLASIGPAQAYVLPSPHVIRRVNRRLAKVHRLQVALLGATRAGGEGQASIGERWIFRRAGAQARVDGRSGGGRRAGWVRGQEAAVGRLLPADRLILPSAVERQVFGRLFADADLGALLRDLGVDLSAQRLTLMGDRVAIVIGQTAAAQAAGEMPPQIWVDQDDFRVLRVRYLRPDGQLVDLQLIGWRGPPTWGTFPRRVRVLVGGRWVRVMEVDAIEFNPDARSDR